MNDDILESSQKLLESCKKFETEMSEMDKDIEFLQNEYKTNKRYFCDQGRPSVNDVIRTVYEFAWQKSKLWNRNA